MCSRYIAIFHLVTAADGAEKFYSLENNGVRIESIEQAKAVDARTCRAWIGHPKLYVFGRELRVCDCSGSFRVGVSHALLCCHPRQLDDV